jgi:hypothetical protein
MRITKTGVNLGEQHFKCWVCETEFVAEVGEYNLERQPMTEQMDTVKRGIFRKAYNVYKEIPSFVVDASCPCCGRLLREWIPTGEPVIIKEFAATDY